MRSNKRNRKTAIYQEYLEKDGELIKINGGENMGIYPDIVNTFVDQLDAAIEIHGRVLVTRFDLRVNYYTGTSHTLSKFIKNMKQWLGRKYGVVNIGYLWVREQEKAKKQHYHMALVLDGNKINQSFKLNKIIEEKWLPHGSVFFPEHNYYFIDKNNMKEMRLKAINRASYLGKTRGKGHRPEQSKDYGSSRLKRPAMKNSDALLVV